ncbi:MAG: helix-turn-helix transcriptional regulator [Coriobacteriia bacterium]|nr:helix-turn-helix transcriptional regulator [Coriobacteriia bacterium]
MKMQKDVTQSNNSIDNEAFDGVFCFITPYNVLGFLIFTFYWVLMFLIYHTDIFNVYPTEFEHISIILKGSAFFGSTVFLAIFWHFNKKIKTEKFLIPAYIFMIGSLLLFIMPSILNFLNGNVILPLPFIVISWYLTGTTLAAALLAMGHILTALHRDDIAYIVSFGLILTSLLYILLSNQNQFVVSLALLVCLVFLILIYHVFRQSQLKLFVQNDKKTNEDPLDLSVTEHTEVSNWQNKNVKVEICEERKVRNRLTRSIDIYVSNYIKLENYDSDGKVFSFPYFGLEIFFYAFVFATMLCIGANFASEENQYLYISMLLPGSLLLLYWFHFFKYISIDNIFRILLSVEVLVLLLTPYIFDEYKYLTYALFAICFACYDILNLWKIALIIQTYKLPKLQEFAHGRFWNAFGMLCGWIVGWIILKLGPFALMVFCLLSLFALFVFTFFVRSSFENPANFKNKELEEYEAPQFWRESIKEIAQQQGLSSRQLEVFELLSHGRDTEFIHKKLFISKNTVKSHRYNIYNKLEVQSQQELISLVEKKVKEMKLLAQDES